MKKIMLLVFLTSLFLLPKQSFALSCAEPSPPEVAYDEYDAVIIGSVEKIKENNDGKTLTIEIDKSFKGVDKKTITVKEDITWGESQDNASYLFFLNKEGDNWVHPLCSPTTHNTDQADEVFADKEKITLQDVEASESEPLNTGLIILIAVILVIVVAVIFISLRKKK